MSVRVHFVKEFLFQLFSVSLEKITCEVKFSTQLVLVEFQIHVVDRL